MLERVLRSVQAGEQSFQPASDSAEDILNFQAVADAVIYAQQRGYLRDCRPIYEATSGRRFCVHVIVCSLTHPGREFLADLDRQHRTIPDVLTESLYGIPPSGDRTVDELLLHATQAYRSLEPASRRVAVEKLWDAWERLKTLLAANPSVGNKMLLDIAGDEPKFRALLEDDAMQLHGAGNIFHIRHFKTESTEIARIEQYDYLFHRLFALVNLLLVSLRNKESTVRAD